MAENSLWNNMGLQGNTPDVDSPLQVELAKAMMAALAPKQQNYDPNVRGGWTASMVNALGNIHSAWYRDQALRVNKKLMDDHSSAAGGMLGMESGSSQPKTTVPQVMDYSKSTEPGGTDVAKTNTPEPLITGSVEPSSTNLGMAREQIAPKSPDLPQFDQQAALDTPLQGLGEVAKLPTEKPSSELAIRNGVDNKAPYMARPRDVKGTKKIVFHGDVKKNVDDETDENGKKQEGLLNYGRRVDQARGFDPNYHYYIDRKGNITNGVPEDKVANHVGKYNNESIGIVMAGADKGEPPTKEQKAAGIKLAEQIAKKYNLTQSSVFTHPELMPGHRDKSEGGDVASWIRRNGFKQPDAWNTDVTYEDRALRPFTNSLPTKAEIDVPQGLEREQQFSRAAISKEGKYTDRVAQAMKLGGPTEDAQEQQVMEQAPNQKLAQSYVPQPAKPSKDSSNIIDIPGYKGLAPNVPYLPTQEQVMKYLQSPMIAQDPERVQEIIQDYQKKAAPYEVKVPNGTLQVTPKPGGGGDFKFFATPEARKIEDITTAFDKDGKLNYGIIAPGKVDKEGGSTDMSEYENWLEFKRRQKGADEATSSLYEDKAKHINEAVDQGLGAGGALQTLHTMDALSKATPNMGRGPTKDFSLKAREFIENITGKTLPATEQMETFEKLNGVLASEATKAITSRGTNFDLQTFMRTNPSLGQTKKGTEMITDILQQEYRAKQAIGAMANKMRGSDVHSFNDKVQEYYKNNPIKFTATVNGQDVRVNTRPVTSKEERDKLEVGDGYITPDGKLAIKK